MFKSGMKTQSKLVASKNDNQQNGLILGNGCSSFLAKILVELSKKYKA